MNQNNPAILSGGKNKFSVSFQRDLEGLVLCYSEFLFINRIKYNHRLFSKVVINIQGRQKTRKKSIDGLDFTFCSANPLIDYGGFQDGSHS